MTHEVTVLKLLKHLPLLEQFEAFDEQFEFCNFRYHNNVTYYTVYERLTGQKKCNLSVKHLKSIYGLSPSDSVFLNANQYEVYREFEKSICKYCSSIEERLANRFCKTCNKDGANNSVNDKDNADDVIDFN